MRVSSRVLAQSVLAEIQSGKSVQQVTQALAAYLVAERRTKDADAVVREIERQLLLTDNQVELRVTTAHGLSESLKQYIIEQFAEDGQKTIINEVKDPAVVGGVLVESGEKRLDLTVRRQLQRLKEMGV